MTTATAEKPKRTRAPKAGAAAADTATPIPSDAQTTIPEADPVVTNKSAVEVYNPIEAGIKLMLDKHGYMLTTPPVIMGSAELLEKVKKGRQELVKFRTGLEGTRKAEKAEALAYCTLVDSEARRIQGIATPIEDAYDKVLADEEARLERIREEERVREQLRIAGHQERIQAIKDVRDTATLCRTSERIQSLIDEMPAHMVLTFEEFQDEAKTAYDATMALLTDLHASRLSSEKAAAELLQQQEALRQQQEELQAKEAAAARTAAIQTKLDDIKEKRVDAAMADTAAEVKAVQDKLELLTPNEATFGDRLQEATILFNATKTAVTTILTNKENSERVTAEQEETQRRLNVQSSQQVGSSPAAESAQSDMPEVSVTDLAATSTSDLAAAQGFVTQEQAQAEGRGRIASAPAVHGGYHVSGGQFIYGARSVSHAPAAAPIRAYANALDMDRPTDAELIAVLSEHFDAVNSEVITWLRDMDLDALAAAL